MSREAASLQARGFNRKIFVKPPRKESDRSVLWRFTVATYRLVDSGRLWYFTSNAVHNSTSGLTRSVFGFTLYFENHRTTDQLDLLLVTQLHNYLYRGSSETMVPFISLLQEKFDGKELNRRSLMALSCKIDQLQNRTVIAKQSTKNSNIGMACLQVHRQNKGDVQAPSADVQAFQKVSGQTLYIGRRTNPVLLYHVFAMACITSDLYVRHLKELQSILTHASATTPTLSFKSANGKDKFFLGRYSDTAWSKR